MPLESCMILLDCSQFMRNGDYIPTRLEAQQDAVNLLVGAKFQSHPESTVGISAGKDLLVSPTDDLAKVLSAVHKIRMSASDASDIPTAVSVASLALKHRRNKNGAQRIILFVGTPVEADVKALQKAGRLLKKNNVAIDVVVLGELERNEPVLQELVDAANGRAAASNNEDAGFERTCHLVSIPPGVLPSDVLASSPVLAEGGGAFAAAAAAGGFGATGGGNDDGFDFGGVDPNMDPELAMALRVSMEEERSRQERMAAASASGGDADMADVDAAMSSATENSAATALSDEEALLQQALAMSMNENDPEEGAATGSDGHGVKLTGEDDEMEEDDEAMQMALQMSLAPDSDDTHTSASASAEFHDPAFVNQMLQDMPGVDPNDPNIQEMLKKAAEEKKKDEK